MKKILIICGPTSSGKTSLAFNLAGKFKGELVCADSRQVYKGLDIGTGKDISKKAVFKKNNKKTGGYFEIDKLKLWGFDLVSPKEEFSVAQYAKIVGEIIKDIHNRNLLPVLVGGTGFYIKAVTQGIDTVKIPKNTALRKNLEKKSSEDLFSNLALFDPIKAGSLNQSDKKNPRRLMRAIEIATWKLSNAGVRLNDQKVNYDTLFIGLTLQKEILSKKIKERVGKRVEGIKKEIKKLIKDGVDWSYQSMSSLGYKQWKGYFEGKESQKTAIDKWYSEEKKYSKRQMTWFKKCKEINWFDISDPDYPKNVEKLVKKWYSSN